MKKTKTITPAQAANIETLITEYLVAKGNPKNHSVYFKRGKNLTSYADTIELRYTSEGVNTSFNSYIDVLNGQQTKSILLNCPLRIFNYNKVQVDFGSNRMREEMQIDFANLLLDPKGAQILANATELAQITLNK